VPAVLGAVDVVMPLLHGPYGEDGTIQGLLELAGVPYVGSGVLASAVCMDKHYMKMLLAGHRLPVGPYVVVHPGEFERDPALVTESVASMGFPVFAKPARAGSSFGISKVHDLTELPRAIAVAQAFDPKVIVEAAIAGREVECGVLGGRGGAVPEASVVGEVVVGGRHEFYDFEAKYLDDAALRLDIPADLPSDVSERVRTLAITAFQALACEGLARVDFFYTPSGAILINEVNTMPGFTPRSMFPMLWQASGLTYPQLVDRLLRLAVDRPRGLR
jgi:D-alanine-D-alanine ligase